MTGLRPYDDQKSAFCAKSKVLSAFENIVAATSANYVFLSYNSEGLMRKEEVLGVMSKHGKGRLITRDYSRFRADVDRENRKYKADKVAEFLFCLTKDS